MYVVLKKYDVRKKKKIFNSNCSTVHVRNTPSHRPDFHSPRPLPHMQPLTKGHRWQIWPHDITWPQLKSVNDTPSSEEPRVKLVVTLAPGSPCASTPQITYFCPKSIWRYGPPRTESEESGHQAFVPCRRPNSAGKLDLSVLASIWSSGMTFKSLRIPTLVSLHVPVNKIKGFWVNTKW